MLSQSASETKRNIVHITYLYILILHSFQSGCWRFEMATARIKPVSILALEPEQTIIVYRKHALVVLLAVGCCIINEIINIKEEKNYKKPNEMFNVQIMHTEHTHAHISFTFSFYVL